MSKYTTELRYICESYAGLTESTGYQSIKDVLVKAIPKVFDFEYPIFDESYRNVLETKILKHFYTREIGSETVGLWKLRLDTKLNEIMPYYNKLYLSELFKFNPLYTTDLTKKGTRNVDRKTEDNGKINDEGTRKENERVDDTTKNTGTVNNVGKQTDVANGSSNTNTTDKYLDTPQNDIQDLADNHYLTNARIVSSNAGNTSNATSNINNTQINNLNEKEDRLTNREGNNTFSRVSENKGKEDTLEDYLEQTTGYSGNVSELILKYRQTFLNIDLMIIKELDDLFIQLW